MVDRSVDELSAILPDADHIMRLDVDTLHLHTWRSNWHTNDTDSADVAVPFVPQPADDRCLNMPYNEPPFNDG